MQFDLGMILTQACLLYKRVNELGCLQWRVTWEALLTEQWHTQMDRQR
ncbi:MAG: hypothetical protein DHS20C16_22580 [Phycisphaerae bacterium]|nr:MAG: hypothetical protein DHS20C16_22580 [Phycisphaerae bacterium]